ncbi:MAG: MFS transporter [Chloroflexi bacterium]|nr:MFS transporter [Chloroflexota bacterium]
MVRSSLSLPQAGLAAIAQNWAFALLALAVFAINFNSGITQSIQTNFFKQDLGMEGAQMGFMTAGREFTGFIIVALAALTMRFAPAKVAAASILLMALGYGGYGLAQNFNQLMVVVVIGGVGFHGWAQLYYTLGLSLAKPGEEGRIMGRLSSIGSVGTLVAMVLTYLIVSIVTMRGMFFVSAIVVILGGIGLFFLPPLKGAVRQQSFVLKRQYWLYYVLNFLDGCRFEIFQTFALFALVDIYGVSVQNITLLLLFNAITNWWVAPIFGKLVDTRGERSVLTLAYVMHIIAFGGFALVHNVWYLCAMYVLGRIFMVAGMSINTYLRKIADPKDLSTSLAMGISTSHMAAIVIPITGGLLWQTFGYEVSFMFGAFFVALSLIFTQRIRIKDYRPEYQVLHAAVAAKEGG